MDLAYSPRAVPGLTLNAAAEIDHARFGAFNSAPCFFGQTVAAGCNSFPDPNPAHVDPVTGQRLNLSQDLSHTQLVRAPDWTINFGADYTMPIGNGMTVVFTSSNQFQSSYRTALSTLAANVQQPVLKADLSVALRGKDDVWELALIGKNITNRLTIGSCQNGDVHDGLIYGGAVTGGTSAGPAGTSDSTFAIDTPRQLFIRLTLRPFG